MVSWLLDLRSRNFFAILHLPARPCVIYVWQTGRTAISRIFTCLHQIIGLHYLHIKVDGEILRQASQKIDTAMFWFVSLTRAMRLAGIVSPRSASYHHWSVAFAYLDCSFWLSFSVMMRILPPSCPARRIFNGVEPK